MEKKVNVDMGGLWERIQGRLQEKGINIDLPEELGSAFGEGLGGIKVVCVAPDLKESVDEMSRSPRDQVVMVRVDEETLQDLDAWVATGAVKSRSEAAALFIREGLGVRSDELTRLRDALEEVKQAKEKLEAKAREVLGRE